MVLRFWGERGLTAESFAHLVDESASGIRTTTLIDDLRRRGWNANGVKGSDAILLRELERGRPTMVLIEDRPGSFHYVVVVASLPSTVVLHDPARAPFRAMARDEFARRWEAADRWVAVVVPDENRTPSAPACRGDACCRGWQHRVPDQDRNRVATRGRGRLRCRRACADRRASVFRRRDVPRAGGRARGAEALVRGVGAGPGRRGRRSERRRCVAPARHQPVPPGRSPRRAEGVERGRRTAPGYACRSTACDGRGCPSPCARPE